MGKLREEFPGILNWLIEGCLRWQKTGELIPAQVLTRKAAHRSEMDELGGFIEDCCILDPRAETRSKNLYYDYEHWCMDNGQAPLSEGEFGFNLSRRGFPCRKGKGSNRNLRTRIGIALKDEYRGASSDADETDFLSLLTGSKGQGSGSIFN